MRRICRGELWTLSQTAKTRHGINWIKSQTGEGLSDELIYTGGNSGYQALSLAVLFGASKIMLLGYDMQKTGGRSHWHGDHPRGMGNGGNFEGWVKRFDRLSPLIRAKGVEVINATRQTALKCFPRLKIEEALA